MKKRVRGDALVHEPTGSATMSNLDWQGENVFIEEPLSVTEAKKERDNENPG